MSTPSLNEQFTNTAEFIEHNCQRYADMPAYHCLGQTLTFADLEEKSRHLAKWFQHACGLQQGDRVAIQLPNLNQYPIAAYAAFRAGLVVVNTNPLYTAREMEHQFNDSGAKALVCLANMAHLAEEVVPKTGIRHVVITEVGDMLPSEGSFATDLGVSRPVMREAFHALAALKVIDVANGRRARVGAIDGSVMAASIGHAISTAQVSLADVWDVRRTLELRTAELAAISRSEEQADAILAAAHALAHSRDEQARTRADTAFHQTIAMASGNPLFFQIVRSFEQMMIVAIPKAWAGRVTSEERQETLVLHQEVAQAIADQDPELARAAMDPLFARSIGDLFHNTEVAHD